jgi:hypothetical protein
MDRFLGLEIIFRAVVNRAQVFIFVLAGSSDVDESIFRGWDMVENICK